MQMQSEPLSNYVDVNADAERLSTLIATLLIHNSYPSDFFVALYLL